MERVFQYDVSNEKRTCSREMTHRKIKDGMGMAWDVWEVYPSAVEQRMSGEVPAVQDDDGRPQERREFRIRVPAALEAGWLAFQSGTQRRRLAPIPPNWSGLSDEELVRLLARADRLDSADQR